MESKQKTETKLANMVAKWLLKDIRLNAEAASSPHLYEPDMPEELKEYKDLKSTNESYFKKNCILADKQ